MKKTHRLFSLLLPLLLLQSVLIAQDNDGGEKKKKYEFEQKKSYNKSYNVSASDKLIIENKFGAVEIHTWAKNEIKVEAQVLVTAKTEDWARAVIEDIQVEDSRSGGHIKFKTLFSEDLDKKEGGTKHMDKYKGKDSRQTMEVNYQVYMPASSPLDIENSFGPITLPDYMGEVNLTSKFGSLTTGNLANIKGISVEFGKANLANISGSPVSIKFSKATVAKLSGAVKLNLEFCNSVRLNLDNNLSSLDLKVSYSTVNLKPSGNLPATYTIATSFGSFKNTSNVKFISDENEKEDENRYGPKFDFEYKGKSGSGSIPVKVKSSFSKIIVGDASEEDMKDKGKNKDKSRA